MNSPSVDHAIWTAITPVPADAPAPTHRAGVEAYAYRLRDGQLYGYVCRWNGPDGKKQIRPLVWAQNGAPEHCAWRWLGLPDPRPLYGSELLTLGCVALVVEGERKCDLTRGLLAGTGVVVLSWCGGARAVKHTDWATLAGHAVTVWPDNDPPGMEAAAQIAALVAPHAAAVRIVTPDPTWPKGHDLGDLHAAGWTQEQVLDWMRDHAADYERIPTADERMQQIADREDERYGPPGALKARAPTPEPEPTQSEHREAPDAPHSEAPERPDDRTTPDQPTDQPPFPFTLLGHDHGTYFYMGHDTRQLTSLKASQHTPLQMNMLAPLSFWVRRYRTKRSYDSDQAAADLMEAQHKIGVYNPTRIRGRGAWWDEARGEALVHLGDRLLIGGREVGLHDHGTRQIYESAVSLPVGTPLRNAEAAKLVDICGRISWENPLNARLLAGWIVCAQICGALRWKPCVWLLGPKESGKSTVIEKIVFKALGENVLYSLGGTTEASLRAMLRADAMPVIIDDMDSSTARARENNQAIFSLMRIFSGEGGGGVHKASQSGGPAITYKIHSCYIYSGITLEADKGADLSRIAALRIVPRDFARDQYQDLLAFINATLTPEYSANLFARCIRQIPTIRKNAETFAQAIAAKTTSRRSGDLNGHLFAGAYSLMSEGLITREAADAYVGTRAEVMALMQEEKQTVTENNEGDRCLSHLLEQVITDSHDGRMMRASIYELLQGARDGYPGCDHARKLLRRHGVIFKGDAFYIANDHSALRDLFGKSAWPIGWGGILKSKGGAAVAPAMDFGGRISRATKIPLDLLAPPSLAPIPPPDDYPAI